ncbi:hypothetical protein [Micromonospora sp. NBC_01813]|uniref:hypothetical protein n=1 Tax=Micromonospora sp. NBC_01813 TaxID=2975988 RepID=UPI002DD8E8ED|nr:hypothetical protein [Micromonospora sp. NBC_01813]WSA09897.1 hypothetical protein OG958_03575 [Micromonospora sp. NBC_01813]
MTASGPGAAGRPSRSDGDQQPERARLAAAQHALITALVTDAPDPVGFDHRRLSAARTALLRKRAGETARHWPMLAHSLAGRWPDDFVDWAAGRPSTGGLRDGWDFVREWSEASELPALAARELAEREARWRYDGRSGPRRRWWPALRRTPAGLIVQIAGRVRLIGTRQT